MFPSEILTQGEHGLDPFPRPSPPRPSERRLPQPPSSEDTVQSTQRCGHQHLHCNDPHSPGGKLRPGVEASCSMTPGRGGWLSGGAGAVNPRAKWWAGPRGARAQDEAIKGMCGEYSSFNSRVMGS